MTPPKAILFDAGNTLVWLDHPYLLDLVRQHGIEVSMERLLDAEHAAKARLDELVRSGEVMDDRKRGQAFFAEIFRQVGIGEEAFPPIARALWARHAERNLWSNVRERTAETLEELRRRGYRLGVISNADGRVEALLESVGLGSHFEFVIDSTRVGIEKPDPRIFHIGAERLGIRPEEAVYVGDIYEVDVQGARAAGMRAILIDPLWRWSDRDCDRIRGIHDLLDLFPETA
jgi:putative hydrolase of the HAD superfamily